MRLFLTILVLLAIPAIWTISVVSLRGQPFSLAMFYTPFLPLCVINLIILTAAYGLVAPLIEEPARREVRDKLRPTVPFGEQVTVLAVFEVRQHNHTFKKVAPLTTYIVEFSDGRYTEIKTDALYPRETAHIVPGTKLVRMIQGFRVVNWEDGHMSPAEVTA